MTTFKKKFSDLPNWNRGESVSGFGCDGLSIFLREIAASWQQNVWREMDELFDLDFF